MSVKLVDLHSKASLVEPVFGRPLPEPMSAMELVEAARGVLRDARLLPWLALPERVEDVPCTMPGEYQRFPGCKAPAGEGCRNGLLEPCERRVESFNFLAYIRVQPEKAFACPGCRAIVGQSCIRTLWPEWFEPEWDHAHPSRRRLGDAVRAVMGGPPLRCKAYAEWVHPWRWRATWTRALGEAYYVLHYEVGTEGERARARRLVDAHEALPVVTFTAPTAESARRVAARKPKPEPVPAVAEPAAARVVAPVAPAKTVKQMTFE